MANISKLSSHACGSCSKSFKKYPQLQKHRIQERDAGNGHMHCETCGIDFPFATQLIAHFREHHPAQEGFDCPGCREHCKYVGDLVSHIEGKQCPKITVAEWEAFSKESAARKAEPGKPANNFAGFIKNTQAGSTATWEAGKSRFELCHVLNSGPIEGLNKEEFPALPGKAKEEAPAKAAVLKISGTGNAWKTPESVKGSADVATASKKNGGKGKAKKLKGKSGDDIGKNGGKQSCKQSEVGDEGAVEKAIIKAAKKLAIVEKGEAGQLDLNPVNTTPKSKLITASAKLDKNNSASGTESPSASVIAPAAQPAVAWGQKKNLFPDAAPAKRPTAEQLRIATAPNARVEYLYSIHDPNHAHFDAEKYKSANGRYVCPMDHCVWTYETAEEITEHLRVLGEHGGKKAECPGCSRRFKTASALAHHAQMTQDDRCRLRGSSRYTEFVEEVSGGMVTVAGANPDLTTRYETTERASTRFGPVINVNKWDREMDSDDERL